MKRIVFVITTLIMLAPVAVLAEYISVKVPVANIRSGPSETSDLLWKVEKYHPLFVLGKKGSWYHFRDFEGDEGWISDSLVGKDAAVITIRDDCNIRSGPDIKYDVLFTAEDGIPFKVLKKQGQWLNVVHEDGDRGWIHQSLVWPNE